MKKSLLLVLGLLLLLNGACLAQLAQEIYSEAQRAYMAGNVEEAKEKFKLVLEMNPKHVGAQGYVRMITVQEKRSGGGGELQKQLQSLVLPKVEFRNATFGSALEYLKQQAAKQSGEKVKVSFVVQLPPEFSDTRKVTLNLANVPFLEAVRYVCDQGEVAYAVEKYAVVIKSKTAVEKTVPAATPASAQ